MRLHVPTKPDISRVISQSGAPVHAEQIACRYISSGTFVPYTAVENKKVVGQFWAIVRKLPCQFICKTTLPA